MKHFALRHRATMYLQKGGPFSKLSALHSNAWKLYQKFPTCRQSVSLKMVNCIDLLIYDQNINNADIKGKVSNEKLQLIPKDKNGCPKQKLKHYSESFYNTETGRTCAQFINTTAALSWKSSSFNCLECFSQVGISKQEKVRVSNQCARSRCVVVKV